MIFITSSYKIRNTQPVICKGSKACAAIVGHHLITIVSLDWTEMRDDLPL